MTYAGSVEWWRADLAPDGAFAAPAERGATDPEIAGSPITFWALMAFTFVLMLAPQALIPALAPLHLGLLTAGVAITTYLLDRFIYHRPIMNLTPEIIATICLVAWALVTVPWSYWPGGSLGFLLNEYFKTLAIFWLLGNVLNTRERLLVAARGLALMAAPLAAYGVHEYLAGNFMGGEVKRIVSYEAPLTSNPNDLALILNLILPLTLGLAMAQERTLSRLLLLGFAGLDALAIILTFSRAGFICLAVTSAIYFTKLMRRPERGWAIAAFCLALAALPFLPAGYVERLSTITNIEADPTGSAQERRDDTLAALQFISQSPIIGAGVGMNMLALNEIRGASWKNVHNVYLELATDLGIPGLILFLTVLVGCVRSVRFVMRQTAASPRMRDLFLLAEGLQVSLVVFAIAAVFHPVAYQFYFYYMAGLALAARAACGANTRG
jgi:putative inorganic carbon (HCO3(-)) transporter